MLPFYNDLALFIIGMLSGLALGMILLDPKKHDYDDELQISCTKSKHLFPINHTSGSLVYCFCGNEVLEENSLNNYIVIKA